MKKVLLLQEGVSPVRIPIYNEIARHCELTIIHSKGPFPSGANFAHEQVEKLVIRSYKIYRRSIYRIAQQFDVLIAPLAYVHLDILMMLFFKRPCKIILWGIGVPASYVVRYDDPAHKNPLPRLIRRADATLFYSDYPKIKYVQMGFDERKLFVANNTVSVKQVSVERPRSTLLFIGSLYPQKKVYELVQAYHKVALRYPDMFALNIVGEGSEFATIQQYVQESGLAEKVNLVGAIYGDDELEPYFLSACACLSPDQAGLSVLKAMGYGVPFITTQDAFSGGERLNIHDGVDGILLKTLDELEGALVDIYEHPAKYEAMGRAAYEYYWVHRRPEQMAKGFLDAIGYVTGEGDGAYENRHTNVSKKL